MMNEALQRALAEHVYEEMRKSLILVNSAMLPWPDLPADQQAQFMASMRIWLMGIGSNEVGAEWYKRSGQMPQWFWQQLEGYEHENIFVMAGVKMLFKLVELAEKAIENHE